MTSHLPPWSRLEAGTLPPTSDAPGEGGRLVAVLATDGALAAGWAEACAVEAVGAWASAGERIVLADLNLHHPTLHAELDLPNVEGLSDVLLWGASVRHVAQGVRRAGESGFYLIPAGTAVADPAATLDSPRWAPLCDGFRDAGVTLVAFVSDQAPARDAVLSRSSAVVVVATEDEDLGALAAEGIACPVMAVVGRPEARAEVAAPSSPAPSAEVGEVTVPPGLDRTAEATEPEPADPAVVEPERIDPGTVEPEVVDPLSLDVSRSGVMDAEAPGVEAAAPGSSEAAALHDTGAASDPQAEDRLPGDSADAPAPRVPPLEEVLETAAPSKSGRRVVLLLLLLLVVILGVVGAALLGYVHVPGIPVLASPAAGSSSLLPASHAAGLVHDLTPHLPA